MKMIKCGTCGRKVSSKAKRCPKCGTQLRLTTGSLIFILFIILFIAAIILIAVFS